MDIRQNPRAGHCCTSKSAGALGKRPVQSGARRVLTASTRRGENSPPFVHHVGLFVLTGTVKRKGMWTMCDLKAYVKKQGAEELLLESVNTILVQNGEVVVRNLFGEEKRLQGVVSEVSLPRNRVVVEQS